MFRTIAISAAFAIPVLASAGMDEMRVVATMSGQALVRVPEMKAGKRVLGPWRMARLYEKLGPGCEVKTCSKSAIWLQVGDSLHEPRYMPTDTIISYAILSSNTHIKMNSQYQKKKPLIEVVSGHVKTRNVHGEKKR